MWRKNDIRDAPALPMGTRPLLDGRHGPRDCLDAHSDVSGSSDGGSSLKALVLRPRHRAWLLASVGAFAVLTVVVVDRYGALAYLPELTTGFGASLAAFMLALEWEAHRERATLERSEKSANDARHTEARKRLLAIESELGRNKVSIDLLAARLPERPIGAVEDLLHPELLDAAWASSGERLGDLLAEYDLVGDLATFYGRLEELRWRIRHRTQARDSWLDGMTKGLADEMQGEVESLLERVAKQTRDPVVRPVGLVHERSIGGSIAPTGTLTLEKKTRESPSD